MKKNKSSKNWIIKQHRDQYFKQAKSSGFRSRSAYKLLELNKIKVIKNIAQIGPFHLGKEVMEKCNFCKTYKNESVPGWLAGWLAGQATI